MRDLRGAAAKVARKSADAGFDPVAADRILKIDGIFEGGHYGPWTAAHMLIFARVLERPPIFRDDVGPEALLHLAANVQQTGPSGRAQPFVASRGVSVDAEIMHVDGNHAGNLGAVCEAEQVLTARKLD